MDPDSSRIRTIKLSLFELEIEFGDCVLGVSPNPVVVILGVKSKIELIVKSEIEFIVSFREKNV
jgi:hypothetical protein